jgi:hypothetical protein
MIAPDSLTTEQRVRFLLRPFGQCAFVHQVHGSLLAGMPTQKTE